MFSEDPCVLPADVPGFEVPVLGHPVLSALVFVASRCRPNTVLAAASDLRAFFAVVDRDVNEVRVSDVLGFIAEQRRPRGDGRVVRLSDGEAGLSSRTIKRRLSTVSGLYSWLVMLEEAVGARRRLSVRSARSTAAPPSSCRGDRHTTCGRPPLRSSPPS